MILVIDYLDDYFRFYIYLLGLILSNIFILINKNVGKVF